MSKRVVQSVIVFAVAIVSYLLYSAVVKDDKTAPAEERAEQQDAEDVEVDTVPVITKVGEPTAAKFPEPAAPTFVETTPKAAVVQKPKTKKQDKEPEVAVETIEPVAAEAVATEERPPIVAEVTPIQAETVPAPVMITPKAVPVQEPEAVKHEIEPETAEDAVEPEVEKDIEVEVAAVTPIVVKVEEEVITKPPLETKPDASVEAVPVVEIAAVRAVVPEAEVEDKIETIQQEKEPEAVAVATEPVAEKVSPVVAAPIIETEKIVSVEESPPVAVEEKVDTSVLEQQSDGTEERLPVETKEDIEAEPEAETTLALVVAAEAEVTDKSEKTEQEKAGPSTLISAVAAKETVETEIIEEEKEPKTVVTVIEQEPEKAAPVVKPINDSKEETPNPRTQEDEKKAQKTYKDYGSKTVVPAPEAEEEEMLLHQHVGYFTRDRNGVDGLGRLQESKMLLTVGVESGQSTYGATLNMVQLESGKLKIADSGLYGTDGTIAVETPADSAGGMALSLNYRYEQKSFALSGMVGITPSVSNDISAAPLWDVAVEGNFDVMKTYGRFVQCAVVDSLLSSVGNSDLYTKQVWGRVVKQGLEAGVRLGDEYKFALDLGYYPVIKGKNTLENNEITTTVSVVKPVSIPSIDRFDAGLLLAYDDYEFDSEHYTYGHGGYFSPQSYMRGGVLFDMTQQFSDSILFDARASVGYTSYKNEAVEKYPFEAGAEMYAAESSKFISAETAVFLGMALDDSAQVMTGAGYSNHTNTNEYFLSIAIHIYLDKHRMTRRDFASIDRFSNTSR